MFADLRNIVCRGGIWYFGKHKVLKPKEKYNFFSRLCIHFKEGNGTIDLGSHLAT